MESKLLAPVQLGALSLKNRVIMAPLTRCRADNPEAAPTALMARYYAQRAGAGLIISEGTIVSLQARGYPYTPGIWSDAQVAGWRLVTDAVHQAGGLIVCQLWHCGRLSLPEFHGGELPVAPSAINPNWRMFSGEGLIPTVTPRALSREDIAGIVADFQPRRAQRGGRRFRRGRDSFLQRLLVPPVLLPLFQRAHRRIRRFPREPGPLVVRGAGRGGAGIAVRPGRHPPQPDDEQHARHHGG